MCQFFLTKKDSTTVFFTTHLAMSELNQLLDHFSLRSNGEIDWTIAHDLIQTDPSQVDDRTLLNLITVGFYEDETKRWNPCKVSECTNQLPLPVLNSVLDLVTAPLQVEDPQDVFIHAFLYNGISTNLFEKLMNYRKESHFPNQHNHPDETVAENEDLMCETWWKGYSEEELIDCYDLRDYPWSIEKLNILLRRFSDSIHVILYKAIETNQSLAMIKVILFFESDLKLRNSETLTKIRERLLKKVSIARCGHFSNFCDCALQALVFKRRFDVWRLLLKESRSGPFQGLNNPDIQTPPIIQKEDVCRYGLLHLLTRSSPSSLCTTTDLPFGNKKERNSSILGFANDFIQLDPVCLSQAQFDYLPIHWACIHENFELVKLLIIKGKEHNMGTRDHRGGIITNISNSHYCNENPLQKLVCKNKFVAKDMIAFFLGSSPPLLLPSDVRKFDLLHRVTQMNQNVDIAKVLLQLEPESLKIPNRFGDLPIHSTITPFPPLEEDEALDSFNADIYIKPKMLELLLVEGMKSNAKTNLALGGLMERNSKGQTVLDVLVQYWIELRHSRSMNEKFWQCINIIRRVVSVKIPLLQAVIRKISPFEVDRLQEVIRRCDCTDVRDHSGNLPLHVAITNKDRIGADGFRIVLRANARVARIRNYQNRLPLQMALLKGSSFQWEGGVSDLFEAERSVIQCIDPVTNLYPFMLSALTDSCPDLNCIYNLLRETPHLVKSHCDKTLEVSYRKRKFQDPSQSQCNQKKIRRC